MTFQRYYRELPLGERSMLAVRVGFALPTLSNAARDVKFATSRLRMALTKELGPDITFDYPRQDVGRRLTDSAVAAASETEANEWVSGRISLLAPQLAEDPGSSGLPMDAVRTAVAETMHDVLSTIGIKLPRIRPQVFTAQLADVPRYATGITISDLQIPYVDWDLLDVVLAFMKAHQFNYIFLNGDLMDFAPISNHLPSPFAVGTFESHVRQGRCFLRRLRDENPNARVLWIPGNHEYRLTRYLASEAPALKQLDALTIEELFGLKDLNIEFKSTGLIESYCQFGDLYIGHWCRHRKHPGWTVKSIQEDHGISAIQAHIHRCASVPKYLLGRTLVGIEQGCLCDLDPTWTLDPKWENGFATILKDGDHCDADLVRARDGRFVYQGIVWSTTPIVETTA